MRDQRLLQHGTYGVGQCRREAQQDAEQVTFDASGGHEGDDRHTAEGQGHSQEGTGW